MTPQRVAVFSDVHGNVEALEAVLADIARAGVDDAWCLGDVIGNGHDPVGCFDLVEARCSVVLAGNHEVVIAAAHVAGAHRRLPPAAEHSRALLAAAGGGRLERLHGRSSEWRADGAWLAHGCPSPFDPVRDYLDDDVAPGDVLAMCAEGGVVCVGHTHVAATWRDGSRTLVNIGSVGEPRDGGLQAVWIDLTWVDEGIEVVFHGVDFDLESYRRNMRVAGLDLPPMWR